MSQPNTDPSVQNGLPYKWDGNKNPNYAPYAINNGVGSSQSSRDSSPIPKFSNVPLSQLPPIRGQIPSSQLPPGRPSVSPIVGQQPGFKSASYLTNTPQNSPVAINTSTPIMRKTEHTSALAGNNSFVNVRLSSESVPPVMPNDSNVRMPRSSPVQTNGSQATTNIRQNLNQPLTTSKLLDPTKPSMSHLTGNLLTNQADQPIPSFLPVNTPLIYPVPPNSQPSDKNITEQSKPQTNAQSHFMNPAQSRFIPPSTQNVSASSQNQPSNVLLPNTTTPMLNPDTNNFPQGSNKPPVPTSALFAQGPQQMGTESQPKTTPNFQSIDSQKQVSEQLGSNSNMQDKLNIQTRIPNPQMGPPTTAQQPVSQPMTSTNSDARGSNALNQQNFNPLLMGATNPNFAQLSNQMISPPKSTIVNNQYLPTQNTQQYKPLNPLNGPPISQSSVPPVGQNTGFNRPPMNPYMTNQNVGLGNQQIRAPMPIQNVGQTAQSLLNQRLGDQVAQSPRYENIGNQQLGLSNPNAGNKQFSSTLPNQTQTKPAMPPVSNQSVFPPALSTQNARNQQFPSSFPNTSKPMSNQSAGTAFPPTQGLPLSNQNRGFQPYATPLSNQSLGKPAMSSTSNQHPGNVLPAPLTNQNQQQGPPLSNQNLGSQQLPPSQNFNQYGPPMQNKPNLPSQNLFNQQMGAVPTQNIGNQNLISQLPVNMPASQLSGPQTTYSNPNEAIRPPLYNPELPPQKQENVISSPSTPTSTLHGKRYPQTNYQQQPSSNTYNTQQRQNAPNQMYQQSYGQNYQNLHQGMSNMSLGPSGFNRIYGTENIDLLQCPNILPPEKIEPPKVCLGQECLNNANCSSEIFRCTMTKIPETNSLLQKSRLPLGVLIHPFKDLNHLPVIQCSSIVRCRACRTYINPFVYFVDTKRWKCNLCYRVNELPEEFQYDPVSKSYGDPSRRPEIKASTIEYIAPSEYMLRPPQPAVYLFLLDVSRLAIESGYLHTICEVLTSQLQTLPGDSRTQIGFIAYNSLLHFYSLGEGLSQPHEMTVLDVDDVFLPCPDNLLVNLKERVELVSDLLALLPTRFINSYDNGSALGAAIQAAFKMMSATGGRITIFQASLPTTGPGALTAREDPNQRAGKEAPHLNPATDFYKRLALECSGHQIAVDLFILNSQYVDIATLSGISRFSGGCMHHFPLFKASKAIHAENLEKCFKRYLTRKIGFEAVMRIRCTRGLAVHTFHGNFFVRSTDLLSLPNINPDAGFGMQVSIEESLSDLQSVCFQAALLYTSSKGERRIRVHTLCLPVANNLSDVLNSADQQCIVGILSKMAVDRSLQSSLSDARDAFINVAIDVLQSYKVSLNLGEAVGGLQASHSLKLLPMYILALLKHVAFRSGLSTRLDDRVFAMCDMKTLPLCHMIQQVYPDLYPIHNLTDEGGYMDPDGTVIPLPPRIQLTSRNIDAFGVYLLDCGQQIMIFVCQKVSPAFLSHVLGVPSFNAISDQFHELPKLENPDNQRLHTFIASLNDEKPYCASLHIMRENSPNRNLFLEKLIEDRMESALSYNEFLQHIKTQVK